MSGINPQNTLNYGDLPSGKRVARKGLITVVRWGTLTSGYRTGNTEVLGARTEDSSIEFNADVATSTDVLGVTYTDVNKTEPQQTFDPFYLLSGSELGAYLADAALKNNLDAYNNCFDVYIITTFIDVTGGTGYKATLHKNCSIVPTSMGGDTNVSMPIELHYSNNIETGKVDKLGDDFVFTKDSPASV